MRYVASGTTDEGRRWLAMQWLEGETLAARLGRGPVVFSEAVTIGIDVLDGLAAMHDAGIVHRDIKPSNVMIDASGRATIVDVGIALHRDGLRTRGGSGSAGLLGTLGFLAPEQARASDEVDARADLFAAGCLLWACVTGKAPFRGNGMEAILAKLVFEDVRLRDERRDDVPPLFDAIVGKLMAKSPSDRYSSAHEARDALERCSRTGVHAPVVTHAEEWLSGVLIGMASASVSLPHVSVNPSELQRIATRHHGHAEALLGGGFAVRWVGSAHATRAARCALELRRIAPRHALALALGRGQAIDRAVAILAKEATIRVDPEAAALLRDRFHVTATLELAGERGRPSLPDTDCFGRSAELDALAGALARSRVVLVLGNAGIGKTHLVAEHLRRSVDRRSWLGRGDGDAPFGLIGAMLRANAGIRMDDDESTRHGALREHVRAHVAEVDVPVCASFLGEIAGAPNRRDRLVDLARRDPQLMRHYVKLALSTYVRGLSGEHGLVIVVDDADAADMASLSLFSGLGDATNIILLAKTERGDWKHGDIIRLGPLDNATVKDIVRAVAPAAGDDRVDRIALRAEGNPLFARELARMGGTDLPATIRAVIETRIASLSDPARRSLRAASVFGETFWAAGVRALVGPEAKEGLDELALAGIASVRSSSRFGGEEEWTLSSTTLRETVYATLSTPDRSAAHVAVATWLEAVGEADAALARHLELGEERTRAARFLLRAARSAAPLAGHAAVVALVDRGLACDPDRSTALSLRVLRARLEQDGGDPVRAHATAQAVLDEAKRGDVTWAEALGICATCDMRFGGKRLRGYFEAARSLPGVPFPELALALATIGNGLALRSDREPATWVIATLEEIDDLAVRAQVHGMRALVADLAGEPERVAVEFDARRALAESVGDRRGVAHATLNSGYGRILLGAYDEAEARLREAIDLARAATPGVVRFAECNLVHALWRLGKLDEAERIAAGILGTFDRDADDRFAAATRMWCAEIARDRGRTDDAERLLREAIAVTGSAPGLRAQAKARLSSLVSPEDGLRLAVEAREAIDVHGVETGADAIVRLAHIEALQRAGRPCADAIARAKERLAAIASGIRRSAWRDQFLGRPRENVAIQKL